MLGAAAWTGAESATAIAAAVAAVRRFIEDAPMIDTALIQALCHSRLESSAQLRHSPHVFTCKFLQTLLQRIEVVIDMTPLKPAAIGVLNGVQSVGIPALSSHAKSINQHCKILQWLSIKKTPRRSGAFNVRRKCLSRRRDSH
jgi:hypothetical protein